LLLPHPDMINAIAKRTIIAICLYMLPPRIGLVQQDRTLRSL
jgi:hypothetical protein